MGYCECDYEPPEFYHKEVRKANKDHKCSECGLAIYAGESYEHVRGKWDGDIGTHKTCPRCLALKEWVKAHVPCICWGHGAIREDALGAARYYANEAPGLLFGAYRREVAIRRNRKAEKVEA